MPTKRRVRQTQARDYSDEDIIWALLTDTWSSLPEEDHWAVLLCMTDDDALLPYWKKWRKKILATWIKTLPGTRPSYWWRYESQHATIPPTDAQEQREWLEQRGLLAKGE